MAETLEEARLKLAKQDRTEANELHLHCSKFTLNFLMIGTWTNRYLNLFVIIPNYPRV